MPDRRPGSVVALVIVPFALLTGCAGKSGVSPVPVVAGSTVASPSAAQLAAEPKAGKAGGEVRLSGDGYPAGSRVVFTFHGERVGDATTDGAGRFAGVLVKVPDSFQDSPPGTQFVIGATSGPFYADTPFVLTR
ncbi:hypothetical protein FHS29_001886 [Saccharothrix tamanrassetensis]|uniref:Bacterial Ig domain-containing protein n=1 Tax=Saccharothrix tamanrassetensis TaxID=1051531 RepID=A0A841CH08_9PSEU|nr:hypothetical protein [Saccharothrix tamanrassetensis]MBB5955305.1 hypothetical protein [Saccharothrix tamanrassetensis]